MRDADGCQSQQLLARGTTIAGAGAAAETRLPIRISTALDPNLRDLRFMNGIAGKVRNTSDVFATVHLDLESRPECVTFVRSVLAGLGDHLELDPELTDDLKTAVSEACNNVVLHAYEGGTGPLALNVEIAPDTLDVSVRDRGSGIRRAAVRDENRMGVGLAVISALAHKAEFETWPGEGTEVRMSFSAPSVGAPAVRTMVTSHAIPPELSGEIFASVAPSELLLHVMGRLVRAVAAGSHFAVDRFASLSELTQEIGAVVSARVDGGSVAFAIVGRPRRIELEVGPLPAGSSEALFGGAVPPASIEPLLEELHAVAAGGGELLRAVIVEPRP